MDLGPPISYEGIGKDTPVYSSDGQQIGKVAHVLADEREDLFEGIVIAEHLGRDGHRFADAEDISEIHERGVLLKLDQSACQQLPRPTANPAVMREDPAEKSASKLERAWNRISGKY